MRPTQVKGCNQYGAQMGRGSYTPACDDPIKLKLYKVRLDAGGYDEGGAYWGVGKPLYCAYSDEPEVTLYHRANSREEAKTKVKNQYPKARFYR